MHGIYPAISFLNIVQAPVHLVWISLVNRLSFSYDINPQILTDGMLWFKDLSAPDPYGVLPLIAGIISYLNVLSASTTNLNQTMRKLRRFVFIIPFMSIPIWMTFPAAFNLYWIASSLLHCIILNLFRNVRFRNMIGIPQYLPGSKLEKLNVLRASTSQSIQDFKVFTQKPTKPKAAR